MTGTHYLERLSDVSVFTKDSIKKTVFKHVFRKQNKFSIGILVFYLFENYVLALRQLHGNLI